MANADMFPGGFIQLGNRGGPPPPQGGMRSPPPPPMGGPPCAGSTMMHPRPQPPPAMAQANMGQPVIRQPMMPRPQANTYSTHEISDLRDEFRSPEDCRDRLTTYYVFRIEPVDSDEDHTAEGERIQQTWMNAHVTEIRDLPRKEIIRQIRQLNKTGESGLAEKKKSMAAAQQRQIEKTLKKLVMRELTDWERFEITLVQLDDKRRDLTSKEYKEYEKKQRGAAKLGTPSITTTTTTVPISKLNSPVNKKKKKKKKQKRISITVYFKSAPKPGVDVEALMSERETKDDEMKVQSIHSGVGGLSGPYDIPRAPMMDQMAGFSQRPAQEHFLPSGPFNPNCGQPRQGPGPGMHRNPPPHPVQSGRPPPPQPQVGRLGPANKGRDGRRRNQSDSLGYESGSNTGSDSGSESDSSGSSRRNSWSRSEDGTSMPTSHSSISDGRRRKGQRDSKKDVQGPEYHPRSSPSRRSNQSEGDYTFKTNGGGGRQKNQCSRRQARSGMPQVPSVPTAAPIIIQLPMQLPMQQQHMIPAFDMQGAYNAGRILGKAEGRKEALLMGDVSKATAYHRSPERLAGQPRYLPEQVPVVRRLNAMRPERELAVDFDELEERERDLKARQRKKREKELEELTTLCDIKMEEDAQARAAYYRWQQQAELEDEEEYRRESEEQATLVTDREQERHRYTYLYENSPHPNPVPRPAMRRGPTVSYWDRRTQSFV